MPVARKSTQFVDDISVTTNATVDDAVEAKRHELRFNTAGIWSIVMQAREERADGTDGDWIPVSETLSLDNGGGTIVLPGTFGELRAVCTKTSGGNLDGWAVQTARHPTRWP